MVDYSMEILEVVVVERSNALPPSAVVHQQNFLVTPCMCPLQMGFPIS